MGGIDCVIHIDTASLLKAGIRLYVSASGAVLIPAQVGVEHITRALLMNSPKLTLYQKPTAAQLKEADPEQPSCQCCATLRVLVVLGMLGAPHDLGDLQPSRPS